MINSVSEWRFLVPLKRDYRYSWNEKKGKWEFSKLRFLFHYGLRLDNYFEKIHGFSVAQAGLYRASSKIVERANILLEMKNEEIKNFNNKRVFYLTELNKDILKCPTQ